MPRPHPTAPVLAAVVLAAGVLQVMATVMLGLAPLEELRAAAAEGARHYLLATLATTLGLIVVWFLRRRPLWAVLTLLVWQGAVFWPLRTQTSGLGLAFHGEYVLHHFTGLVAAATCIAIATGWIRRTELGLARLLPAGLAILGTLALVVAHVAEQPSMGTHVWPWLERAGAATLLLAWGLALVTLWRHLGPSRFRLIAIALLLPFLVRVAFAWPEGLAGASVSEAGRPWVMTAMMLSGLVTFALFRPPLGQAIRALVLGFSAMATVLLYYFYRRGFGELEAGLGGLAQSMFAFSLPYPTYAATWKVWLVMFGLFAIFAAAYSGLVSSGPGQRVRGIALALLVVTGLGLSTPPLVLMTSAAVLLWIDSLLGGGLGARVRQPPPTPMRETLEATAADLDVAGVVALEDGKRALLAIRGDVNDTAFDVRVRATAWGGWEVTLVVGVLGRGRAELRLLPEPGDEGHRPAHELGRTHQARGLVRQLELVDDTLFDALMPFPQSRIELWDAGTRIRLGDDLSGLDPQTLATLVRQLAARE